MMDGVANTSDEDLRKLAKEYADAKTTLIAAERDARDVKNREENARVAVSNIEERLKRFVGRNVHRKLVKIDEGRAVSIQLGLANTAMVTLEDLV
jgi:hypothetical protein